ncbi:long-chain-fatty-acid--CoA ligase [Sinimarinibacterium flocculans]|uniref:long-chain-fatty-acid--CoA ligase n=1 Tax=Sinimarinibacterium flocculans TaxID=985250 RepID=UPI00351374FB
MFITQTLRRAVQINASGTATVFGERRRTWTQFQERVARLAGALKELNVGRADRVAILSLNSDRYLEYFYGVAWAGAASNPVNIRLAPPEIAYTLDDSRSGVLFLDDAFSKMLPALRPLLTAVRHVIFIGDGPCPEGCIDYEQLLAQSAPVPDANAGGSDLAGLFYTGGTTGKSKGVMLSHDNIVYNALNVLPALGYDDRSVYLHAAPMFHLADMASTFAVTMAAGTHVAVPRFDVDGVLEAIAKYRVTHSILVPTMINLLVNSGRIADYDLSSFRRLMYGASPMPEAVLKKAMALLPGVELAQGYGQTEAAPVITFLEPRFHVEGGAKLTSAGRPAYGVEVMIVDPEDRELPRGQVGEICARGLNVMQGYWGLNEQTAQTLRNGWLHTGDIGYMDEDGFVFIVDRAKDMIISGGENVFSVEVEGAIYQHPGVQECAVIGVPSEQWGEAVHAVVVPKPGVSLTAEQIIEHCRQRIAGYKLPRSVSFRSEPLPVSGAGKILKTEVRKPYWEGRGRQVS